MKFRSILFSYACILASVTFAGTPAVMSIKNDTAFMSNAYVHDMPSPKALAPYSSEKIPWVFVEKLCHNTVSTNGEDPCAFEVYATDDSADPKKIDVGTVTMYLTDGGIAGVVNKARRKYGLWIQKGDAGQFALRSKKFA